MTNDIFSLLNQHEINNNDLFQQALQNIHNSTSDNTHINTSPEVRNTNPCLLAPFTATELGDAANHISGTLITNLEALVKAIVASVGSATNGIIGSICACCKNN